MKFAIPVFFLLGWITPLFAQIPEPHFSDHVYLGASKEKIIEIVVRQAKTTLKNNQSNAIAKSPPVMEQMLNDLRKELQKHDYWLNVDFTEYGLNLESLVGRSFSLPGFDALKVDSLESVPVFLKFHQDKLVGFSSSITTGRDFTITTIPYNLQTIENFKKTIGKFYGADFLHKRESGSASWAGKYYPAALEIFTLIRPNEILEFAFAFKPFGEKTEGDAPVYKGTSLHHLIVSVSRR